MDENWQKVQIPLDSVIDSNMADMLRLANDPAFIFNRQVLQGGYLPTSLRFEKNGWFCGIYGYDYDVSSPESLHDAEGLMPGMQVERRQTYVSTAYLIQSDDDAGDAVNFIYYPLTRVLTYASSEEPAAEWVADDDGNLTIVKVSGKTHDFNNDYTFYINMAPALDGDGDPEAAKESDWILVDPEGVDFDFDGNPDLPNSILFDHRRFVYSYTVYDKDQSFTDKLTLNYAMPFYIGSEVHEMSFNDGTFTYGDSNIIAAKFNDWPVGASVEVVSPSIDIATACSVMNSQGNACALDISGSVCLEVDDNLTALTETYYTDINLQQCLCTQSSIGKASTATMIKDGESIQVPLVAAGFVCLSTLCPFTSCNVMKDGCNVYAECLSGAVPVWSAQTVWLLRFFGDDIFYGGQNSADSGIVATYVPQQAFVGNAGDYGAGDCNLLDVWKAKCPICYYACCTNDHMQDGEWVGKQYYCTVYGNKQYSWADPLSQDHVFSSCGNFYVGSVNQNSSCANYKQCVAICVPLSYAPTGQKVDTKVCILLDTMCSNMQLNVQSIGCIVSVTADPSGFSTGSFSNCTPFAPLPGSLPQFIVHEPFTMRNACNSPWSSNFIDCVLSQVRACTSAGDAYGKSVADSLCNKQCALYNYWKGNGFYANMQITPITVLYPTAGWFQSYVSFKGLQSSTVVDRACLDCPDSTMLCVDTPYCCQGTSDTCCLQLVGCYNESCVHCIIGDFSLGGRIVIQASNGQDGEAGENSWWCREAGTDNICYHIGKAGKGGDSGVGFLISANYPQYDTCGCCCCCCDWCNCFVPGGSGGGGGLPGMFAAFPTGGCPELQRYSETWTQGDTPVDYCYASCNVIPGNGGGAGGLGTTLTLDLPPSGKPFCPYACCCPEPCSWLCLNVSSGQNFGTMGTGYKNGVTCWLENAGNWASPAVQPNKCIIGGNGAASACCSNCGSCHMASNASDAFVKHYDKEGTFVECVDACCMAAELSSCWSDTFCFVPGCPGNGALDSDESDNPTPNVYVYAWRCCTDWNYDVVNLQNEANCFGIHLCCNCIRLSNLLMCCSNEPCVEARAVELVPYISDGYIYITSTADAMPAWATSLVLTKDCFWDNTGCTTCNYVTQFCGEYVGRDEEICIGGPFNNGICLVVQSARGCNGCINKGGDSGYGVCVTGCYHNTDGCCYPFEIIVPGGAGGGAGGSGGSGASYSCGPYGYSTKSGANGQNGIGGCGHCIVCTFTKCCVWNVKMYICCNQAVGINGADSPFCCTTVCQGGDGTAGENGCYFSPSFCCHLNRQATCGCPGGCGGMGYDVPGSVDVNCTDCFVRVFAYEQLQASEPWSMSNDSAQATRLGGTCGLTPQMQLPLSLNYVDRLIDVTVSSSHESCYNLATLSGTCASDTLVTFTDACGCVYTKPSDWTRDTGICNSKYINPFVGIMHGSFYGECPFDYGVYYDVTNKCFICQAYDKDQKPVNAICSNNYTLGMFELGGYSGCLLTDPAQIGYTTNSCMTCFDVSFDGNNTATEPYMHVTWAGQYAFCTRLALPNVLNEMDCDCMCRCGYVSSFAKGIYGIDYNNGSDTIYYNECQQSVSASIYSPSVIENVATCVCQPGCACLCVCGADFDCGTFTLKGVYKNTGTETLNVKCIDNDYLTFQYAGNCCLSHVCIQSILDNKTFLDITATNVNCSVHDANGCDNTNETKIASIEMNSEYQIVKQKWDTTITTENIWWLDRDHMMELTADKFLIMEKKYDPDTGAAILDDWNGDQWQVSEEHMRSDFIDSTVLRYGVSSVYGSTASDNGGALFWTINSLDSAHFRLNVYLPLDGMRRAFAQIFEIKELNYGEDLPLDTATLGMYTSMDSHALISQADISSTHVGWHFIIGFHVDSCLRQWSFVFRTNGWLLQKKITGYGYVAANGSLTGGQFPEQHVDQDNGFKGAVRFVNDLADYHNQSVDGAFTMSGAYGTQEQQWYLYKEIKKICSHFMFSEHSDVKNGPNSSAVPLVAKWLPIASNYSAMYSSPSFMLNRLTGFIPVPTTLGSIFDFGVGAIDTLVNVLTAIASPSVWFLNICWVKMGFLQQAIGQFAYTYKTTDRDIDIDAESININKESNEQQGSANPMQNLLDAFKGNASVLTRDSLSFDKQEFEQTCTTKSSSNEGVSAFWIALLQAGIGGLNNFANSNKPSANSVLTKTTPTDVARAFSQFAIENALNASSAGIGANAVDNIMLASKVTAVKTLDMFYSTSSNSNMYAGPGYVCHNMIGYTVAQSMSNRLMAGTQSSMFTALSFLSNLSYMFRTVILKSLSKLLEKVAQSVDKNGVFAMGSGTFFGNMIAAAMRSGQYVTERLIDLNEFFLDMMPKLLQAVCPGFPSPKFSLAPGLSQHDIDIEAKHYYGSKHCLFMWPCFGCESTYFTKEKVSAVLKDVPVKIDFTPQNNSIAGTGKGSYTMYTQAIDNVTDSSNDAFKKSLYDYVHSHYIYAQGQSEVDNVPPDMAVVEGTSSFLPTVPFKNENIDIDSSFTIPPIQDYMVDSEWQIGKTAGPNGVLWTSVKDTKIIDGDTSNMVITDDAALIASTYVAIEVKKQIEDDYIRPVAVTPNALAWNMTGLNVSYDSEMKHGFDGVGYRLVHWAGTSGMGTEYLTLEYCFFDNDHLKRSNKLQPNRFWGSFTSLPTVANKADFNDSLYHQFEIDAKGIGTEQLTASENKNTMRNAIPIFTEQLCTMPAVVKALSSYRLDVVHGITSLATQGRTTQGRYKLPKSVDFNINKHLYRATDEYVNELNDQGLPVGEVVAKMGLEFIGATPTQAFFYSDATRAYYTFVGANTITKQDVWNRFKDIRDGKWDFVNQNVVFQCIGNMSRIMDNVDDNDNDLVDNIFVATMSGEKPGITGEITPPNRAVFDNESWFKTYSFSGGVTFQGPNRYIVNRFICLDYMIDDIVANKGKWKKVPRNVFDPYRKYNELFKSVNDRIGDANDYTYTEATAFDPDAVYYYQNDEGKWKRAYALTEDQFNDGTYYTRELTKVVEGWTHNPFLLATAPLGVSEDADCLFEWQLTFTWTDEMDKLYGQNDYACVNIMAQTMCPGGKKRCEPTHLFLHKGLFTRGENSGYYSFKFSSRNGAGNREQLFIWSDAYIAMASLSLSYKVVTERRTSPLAVEQNDIQEMEEF